MYILLGICSVIISFLIASKVNINSYNCQETNFYMGIAGFFLFSLPPLFAYLDEINTPELEKIKNLEIAKKIRWIAPKAYAIQKNPGALLFISIFFGIICISMMFSKKCS